MAPCDASIETATAVAARQELKILCDAQIKTFESNRDSLPILIALEADVKDSMKALTSAREDFEFAFSKAYPGEKLEWLKPVYFRSIPSIPSIRPMNPKTPYKLGYLALGKLDEGRMELRPGRAIIFEASQELEIGENGAIYLIFKIVKGE